MEHDEDWLDDEFLRGTHTTMQFAKAYAEHMRSIESIALEKLTDEFDLFVGECLGRSPSSGAVSRARGCLPKRCKNAFVKK